MIKLIILLISVSLIRSNELSRIELQHIEINEELDESYLIVNFTDLILHRMRLVQKNPNLVRLESLELEQTNFLNEYFSIDLKKFRVQDENGLNKSSIILLKTSSKKLDREYLCRADIPSCSCENDCFLNLNLSAYFENFGQGMTEIKLSLPILLNDLNDNKPFFYQPEVIIDLNQMEIDRQDLVTIPLKLATDLDSTKANQVVAYELEKVSYIKDNYASILFNEQHLQLSIDLKSISPDLVFLNDKFKLIASDSMHRAEQFILIKYQIPRQKMNNSTKAASPRVTQIQSNVISIISAINDIEIVASNSSESYEIRFKSNTKSQIVVSNKTDSLITLAYFIVEKSKAGKKMDQIELKSEQGVDSSLLKENYSNDFFTISEMRNGLYSISIKSNQYEKIIKSKDEKKISYNLILNIKINKDEIFKSLIMKLPASLFKIENQMSSTQPQFSDDLALEADRLDLQNYLLIVSIACVVLAVFAMLCITISVMCYCCKKFKNSKNKKDEKIATDTQKTNNTNIMVYDVLPNQTKSLASSSSSSCTSSNLSPVTTTTTSVVNEQIHEQKPINPLFDTNLGSEWFQSHQNNAQMTAVSSPLSSSSSSNLIKTVDEVDKYKSDLYRNAQVMYKQKQLFQQQNQSNYYSFATNIDSNASNASRNSRSEIYQAKPISLLSNSSGSSSPSYSFINEVNLNSVDNLKDSIKEKMMNRLNEALTNPNLSSKSFGQISCV